MTGSNGRARAALAIVGAASLAACCARAAAPSPAGERVRSVAELSRLRPIEGIFTLEGWIVSSYECPPCPPRALCKPCMEDHVILSDAGVKRPVKDLRPDERVIVYVGRPSDMAALVVGERCRVRVQVRTTSSGWSAVNDLELVEILRIGAPR